MPAPDLTAFDRLIDRLLSDSFRAHPTFATWAGEHRFDGALEDVSRSALGRERTRLEAARRDLDHVPEEALDVDRRIDRQILLDEIDRQILEYGDLREWEVNPLAYEAVAGNAVHGLLARDFAPLPDRLRNVARRVAALPAFFAAARQNLADVPRVHAETAIEQHDGLVALVRDDVPAAAAGTPVDAEVRAAVAEALPALEEYGAWLRGSLLPNASGDFRLGRDRFAKKLRLVLGTDLSVAELERQAHRAFEETRAELEERAHAVLERFGKHGPAEGGNPLRRALDLVAADHPTRDGLLEACRGKLGKLEEFLRGRDLVALPEDPLAVEWTPPFLRGISTALLDSPGPLDAGQRSYFYVSPIPAEWKREEAEGYLREYNHWQLWTLCIHEALPGHYVQLAAANRHPSRLRAIHANGPFVEGWAVYTERLVVEEGFLEHDPRLALARAKFLLRAVTNTLLDIRVHADVLDEEGALRLLREGAFQEEREARGKWRRARLTSTQLSTYFVGYHELLGLREACRTAWGSTFTLRRFHDRVLAHGSPPVRLLRPLLLDPRPAG